MTKIISLYISGFWRVIPGDGESIATMFLLMMSLKVICLQLNSEEEGNAIFWEVKTVPLMNCFTPSVRQPGKRESCFIFLQGNERNCKDRDVFLKDHGSPTCNNE